MGVGSKARKLKEGRQHVYLSHGVERDTTEFGFQDEDEPLQDVQPNTMPHRQKPADVPDFVIPQKSTAEIAVLMGGGHNEN